MGSCLFEATGLIRFRIKLINILPYKYNKCEVHSIFLLDLQGETTETILYLVAKREYKYKLFTRK